MTEYFTALFFVCLLSGIIGVLTPSDSVKKYIEYLCALCVIMAIVMPISPIILTQNSIFDIFDDYENDGLNYDEIYNNFWNNEDERAIAQTLSARLADKLDISDEWFSLELCVSRTEDGRVLDGVRLYITDVRAISANPETIRRYFADEVGVDCEIVYKFSDE